MIPATENPILCLCVSLLGKFAHLFHLISLTEVATVLIFNVEKEY